MISKYRWFYILVLLSFLFRYPIDIRGSGNGRGADNRQLRLTYYILQDLAARRNTPLSGGVLFWVCAVSAIDPCDCFERVSKVCVCDPLHPSHAWCCGKLLFLIQPFQAGLARGISWAGLMCKAGVSSFSCSRTLLLAAFYFRRRRRHRRKGGHPYLFF